VEPKQIALDARSLAYPVGVFGQGLVVRQDSAQQLTTATATGVKRGYFRNLEIVDATGAVYKIRRGEQVRGIGPFLGYNIFLNRTVEVRLFHDGDVGQMDVETLRSHVRKALRSWDGWAAGGDAEEREAALAGASNVSDLIALLPSGDRLGRR
jgi:hypothetical protein